MNDISELGFKLSKGNSKCKDKKKKSYVLILLYADSSFESF